MKTLFFLVSFTGLSAIGYIGTKMGKDTTIKKETPMEKPAEKDHPQVDYWSIFGPNQNC